MATPAGAHTCCQGSPSSPATKPCASPALLASTLFGQVLVSEEVMAEVLSGGHPVREESTKAAICSGWIMGFSILDEPGWSLVTTDSSHQWNSLREALLEPSRWAELLIELATAFACTKQLRKPKTTPFISSP